MKLWTTKRALRRENRQLKDDVKRLTNHWTQADERFRLYKQRVIELNIEVEALREDLDRN